MWTDYLGTQTGAKAEKFLAEAVALMNDPDQSLELARKFFGLHPGIYEQILRTNSSGVPNEKQLAVGREALQAIQPQYIVRSRIALLTAEYALRSEKQEEAEWCWLEAFRSDTSPIHFIYSRKLFTWLAHPD